MPTLDTLFIIIIFVMAVSIIIAVVDWIYLATLASNSSILEQEVEKKSQEFDTLRKERAAAQSLSQNPAAVIVATDPLDIPALSVDPEEQTIQIVRNVRGNFEPSSSFTDTPAEENGDSPHIAAPPDTSIGTLEYQTVSPYAHDMPAAQEEHQYPAREGQPPSDTDTLSRYPGYGTGSESYRPKAPVSPRVVQLYSNATKDADFRLFWKNISEILQDQPNASITVDLSGIHFMYEKEMEYLEKINYLLAGQGGALTFINCDAELAELINQRPLLRSLVQQKTV